MQNAMIRAFIPSYKSVEISGRNKRYHTYRVEIHHNEEVSYLERRYSDFLQLHKEIRKRFGSNTPFFPPKKVRNSTVKVLESRRTGLENYIQTMLEFSPIPKELLGFLNLHQHHRNFMFEEKLAFPFDDPYNTESTILNQPAAGFVEDPFIESDTSSNISDTVTRGVLDALHQIIVLTTAWISYSVVYFLRKPIGIIKPSLESEFRLSKQYLGWLDVAFLLPYAIVQVAGSQLGDRFGPRLTVALCLTISGTAMFTFGIWSSYFMLLVVLAFNGFGQGPCWPAFCKVVCAWYPDEKLNSVIGILSTSVFVGGALGTFVAVHLQSAYGWRMVFLPASLVAVGLGLLTYCVLLTPDERHMSVPGKEVMMSPAKIGEELIRRKTCWQLWRIPAVPEITATVLCLKVVRYCMFMWLPMYLVHYLQYSVAQAGLFSTIFDVGGSIGSPLLGFILDRKFKKNTLLGMWLCVTVSSISMALFAMTARLGFLHNALFMLIAGASNGGADSLLAGSVSMKMGEANGMRAGAAVTGLINGVGTMGAVLEGPVVGYISDNYGWAAMLTLMIALSALSSLTVFRAMVIQRRLDRKAITEDKAPLLA